MHPRIGTRAASRHGEELENQDQFQRLLRYSHIFASAIHEILDVQLLKEISPSSLSASQFHVLRLLAMNGRHQVGEVAGYLGVSPPAATKNIDKLEHLGLLARSPSKGDRRATLLTVSRKGRRLVQKYEEHKTARLSPVLDRFGAPEIEQFADLLERFAVSLLDTGGAATKACLRCAAYIENECPVGQIHGGCPYQAARRAHTGLDTPERD
ncbi:MAG: MarR family transcriptional regulator [Planctomycetota bacterium]